MTEFKESGTIIQESTTEELRNQYIHMLKRQQSYLTKEISTILSKYNIILKSNEIESIIEKSIITEIKYNGMYTIEKLNEELQEILEEIIIEDLEKESIFTLYLNKIKNPIKRNQMNWIDKVIEESLEQFLNLLKEHPSISEEIEPIISKLKEEIKSTLQKYKEQFLEEYNIIQKKFVTENTDQMKQLINSLDLQQLKLSKYKKFFTLIELSNYELIVENNVLYIVDKETKEKIEIQAEEDILRTEDYKIRLINDEKKHMQGFINEEIKRGFVIQSEKITLTLFDTNETITISKKDNTYEFERDNQLVTSIKEIKKILREIRDNYPYIFNKIIHDRDIIPIIKLISQYNRKIKEQRTKRESYINELNNQPEEISNNENNIGKRI